MANTSPSNARGAGSIPDQGSKTPHASWPKQKHFCNKFNEDLKKKNGLKECGLCKVTPRSKGSERCENASTPWHRLCQLASDWA